MKTNNTNIEKAREAIQVHTKYTVHYNNGRTEWYLANGKRTNKKIAAEILKQFGYTLDSFLAANEAYINAKVAEAAEKMAIEDQANYLKDKIARESKSYDDDIFNLIPSVDELNDVDDEENTENTKEENKMKTETKNAVITPETNAEIKLDETRSEEIPTDDFSSKLAELKANLDAAEKAVQSANDAEIKAYNAFKAAQEVSTAAIDNRYKAYLEYNKFGGDKARELKGTLLPEPLTAQFSLYAQNGEEIKDKSVAIITFHKDKFIVAHGFIYFGRYDTPAQVETVINNLKTAIARGDKEFKFPTVEELKIAPKNTPKPSTVNTPENDFEEWITEKIMVFEAAQPVEVKELNNQLSESKLQSPTLWVKILDGCGNCYGSFSGGVLSAVRVEYNAEPEAIRGYTVRYSDEWMAVYDTLEQVKVAIEQFKAAITNNAESFAFPKIKELDAPPTDIAKYQAAFDTAQQTSVRAGSYWLTINGEKIWFNYGELRSINSERYRAEITFNKGKKRFHYRDMVIKAKDFHNYMDNEVIAADQKELFDEFKADYQSSDTGYFQICIFPRFVNCTEGSFFASADDFNHALDIMELFKTLDLPFIGLIKRNIPFGEEYYRHNRDGSEVINPPEPKLPANIKESFKRAMKIALENYHRYNRLHMQTKANYERELFLICKKAYRELNKTA